MNKQELIERIDKLPYVEGPIADTVTVNREWILKSIEQLDEPQKVTVPQFVADWYEKHKNDFEFAVFNYLYMFDKQDESDFKRWFRDSRTEPFQILVSMLQFGYEVEKEKRYLVKIKGIRTVNGCLKCDVDDANWFFSGPVECAPYRANHTRKELEEAGFGEVFDSPLFEVEEVEG
jgi:hypothetical protein